MRLTAVCMLLLMNLVVSCYTPNLLGFLAEVSVNTRGFSEVHIANAKRELIAYVENLGLKKAQLPPALDAPWGFGHFVHPKFPEVFYNLYLGEESKIEITIRDARRAFSRSEELRGEVEKLLELLREKFGEDNVTFKQRSTFPMIPGVSL